MQTRYRWFRIQLPSHTKNLAETFGKRPFEPGADYGFSQTSNDGTSYRYLWRSRVVVTKLDDEGSPIYEQIDSVSFTDFSIITLAGSIFLRLENPGRSVRDLFNTLETLIGIGFTAKPITFEKRQPSTVFNSVDSARLIGLKIVGAVLSNDLVARMEFASKEGMTIDKIEVLRELQYKVEHAVFEVVFSGLKGQIAFAANGSVKISGQIAPKLVNLVEQDLPLFI